MNQKNKCNCECNCEVKSGENKLKILNISWQRLIADGDTCPRCGSTEDELDNAILELKEKLNPKGIEVVVEKKEISLEEFKNNPKISNSIYFNGQLFEDLINAKTGQSKCCGVCGDKECRTVEIQNKSLETIPSEIIVEAGLKVASNL